MQNGEEKRDFKAYIKEYYTDKRKGHLNHQDLYSLMVIDNILSAFRNITITTITTINGPTALRGPWPSSEVSAT
jgi:hypothetical protein